MVSAFYFIIFGLTVVFAAQNDIEENLKVELLALGFPNGELPLLLPPPGAFVDVVQTGKLLILSSAAPQTPPPSPGFLKGRVPNEVSAASAQNASKLACIRQLNRVKIFLGDFDKVRKIVKVEGKILSQPDFTGHTAIIDACSTLLVRVFGEDIGKHARSSGGLISTPFNVTLELEMIVERK